jgi:signal transduction histidine kinase
MKLVAKYTLVLVSAIAIALSLLTVYRMNSDRSNFENDMGIDHRVVGHVLQSIAADQWRDQGALGSERGPDLIQHLIDRANDAHGPTRFTWTPGPGEGGAEAREEARDDGDEYVSRFPVKVDGKVVGTISVSESLHDTERLVHHGLVISVISVGLVVGLSLAASLVLGRWLVGKPISQLVDKARRVGRREFGGAVELRRADELGELASAMNAMSSELAQALAQITIETDARVRAVEQMRHADRLSTVGKLAAGVAHELGTPLSIVAGYAQMIASHEVRDEAALDSARAIDREATRMSRIVRQLLDFARRRGPEGTTSNVRSLAERCLHLLAPMAVKAGVETELLVPAGLHVLIDENNFQQVLTNLLVNALHAMPQGGALRVTAARDRSAPPDEPERAPAPCVRVSVADTGTGIAPDVLKHIFEPFFTTKQPGDGTGLGLAVIYGIVVDHQGWITVDTSARGTTFAIFLQEAPS